MRLGEYKDALSLIGRYPWFGVGFAGSPDADLYVGVSNLYLLMAEEMGAVGVALFLVVVAGFLTSLFGAWRSVVSGAKVQPMSQQSAVSKQREALLLGFAAAVTGVMAGGIFDHYLFNLVYPHMSTTFWIYLGLGMSVVRLTHDRRT